MTLTMPDGNASIRKTTHIPNVPRDKAHTVAGASMKAQHKTLPDGTGAKHGWILAGQLGNGPEQTVETATSVEKITVRGNENGRE